MPVFVVVEHGLPRWLTYLRQEPFYALDVDQTLHTVEIDGYLDYVALAHLDNRLDQGSLPDALELISASQVVRKSFIKRCRLFSLVTMDPD